MISTDFHITSAARLPLVSYIQQYTRSITDLATPRKLREFLTLTSTTYHRSGILTVLWEMTLLWYTTSCVPHFCGYREREEGLCCVRYAVRLKKQFVRMRQCGFFAWYDLRLKKQVHVWHLTQHSTIIRQQPNSLMSYWFALRTKKCPMTSCGVTRERYGTSSLQARG